MTDFPPQLPHGALQEIFDDIYFVSGQSRPNFNGNTMQFSRNMTIIREGDALTLINTLRLDEDGLAQLEKLGSIENVVRLGGFHGRDDAFYVDRYGAKLWAAPGVPFERGETIDQELSASNSLPISGARIFFFETSNIPEAILILEREGGIVISCDSLQNWTKPDEYFDEPTSQMMQQTGFFRSGNIGPGWRQFAEPETADFEKLKQFRFNHLLSAHGAPLLNNASETIGETITELYQV